MKKLLCVVVFCLSLLALGGCNVNEMGSLSDLTKPYSGLYECESIMLGGTELTEKFEKLYLELGYGGDFTIVYRGADGVKGEFGGKYTVDEEKEEITLSAPLGRRSVSYTFPMKNGKIYCDYNFGGRLLHAVFASP